MSSSPLRRPAPWAMAPCRGRRRAERGGRPGRGGAGPPADTAAKRVADDHDERIDLGGSARRTTGTEVPPGLRSLRQLQAACRAALTSASPTSPRPGDDRQLFARSEADAIRADSCSTRSPTTRSASSPTKRTRCRTSTRPGSRRSSAAAFAAGAACRAPSRPARSTLRPHRRLRYPGRLPEDLHGHRPRSSPAPARRHRTAWSSRR